MTVDSDQTAELVCERIKSRVATHNREVSRGYELSLSVGATRSRAEGTLLADLLGRVAGMPHVVTVVSPYGPRGGLQISSDRRTAFAQIYYDKPPNQVPTSAGKPGST